MFSKCTFRSPNTNCFCLASICPYQVIQFPVLVVSVRAECVLLDWIPVDSPLCAVWLNGFVRFSNCWLKHRLLFVTFVHASSVYISLEAIDEFYEDLSQLLWKAPSTEAAVVTGDFTALFGYLWTIGRHIAGRFPIPKWSHRWRW